MKRPKIPEPRQGRIAAIYCRKSNASAGESRGRSTAQQLEMCLMAAKALGYEVPERLQFVEPDGVKGEWYWQDVQGRHPGPFRPELTKLMDEACSSHCEFDAVITWRSDRLYRDELVAGYLLRELRANGIRLFSMSRDMAIHTSSGFQAATTEACANRGYRDRISEDVTRDHQMRAEIGEFPGDPSCYGFASAGLRTGRVVPNDEHLSVVRRIFRWFLEGSKEGAPMSMYAIARKCREEGISLYCGLKGRPPRDPSAVDPRQVRRILSNPAYISQIRWGGRTYPTERYKIRDTSGNLVTVICERDYYETQRLLGSWERGERDPRSRLLSGSLVCPDCGCRMKYRKNHGSSNVYCKNRYLHHTGCVGENYRIITSRVLENWVRAHLAPLIAAELRATRLLRGGNSVLGELRDAERQLDQAVEREGVSLAALVGTMDGLQFAAVAHGLREERSRLEARVRQLRATVRDSQVEPLDDASLIGVSDAVLRQGLMQAVRWMSVSRHGVTVLTASGSYIGAFLGLGESPSGPAPSIVLAPSVEATRECRNWVSGSDRFIAGLSRSRLWPTRLGTREELYPERSVTE